MNPYMVVLLEPDEIDTDAFWDKAAHAVNDLYVATETVAFVAPERNQTVHDVAEAISLTVENQQLGMVVEIGSYGGVVYKAVADKLALMSRNGASESAIRG